MDSWLTIDLLLGILLVTSFTCNGLLALWAATSPRHWLVRSFLVLTSLSPLLLIPAYEPWIVFALQTCVIAAGAKIWHWRTARRQTQAESSENDIEPNGRLRFSLGTLLAITPLVALLTAIVSRMATGWPEQNVESWTTMILNGVGSGCAVLLGAWMFATRHKRIVWPVGLTLCLGLAVVVAQYDWLYWSMTVYLAWPPTPPPQTFMLASGSPYQREFGTAWLAILPTVTVGIWLLVCLWFAGTNVSTHTAEAGGKAPRGHKLRQTVARCLFLFILVALATPLAVITWQLMHPKPVPNLPAPEPNGMDDIVAAGASFDKSPILNTSIEPDSTEELAAEIAKHVHAYERLRVGLTRSIQAREWAQDVDFDLSTDNIPSIDNIQAARSAARGLRREAELAQQQGRYGDAVRIALDNVRVAHAIRRDGLLVDHLVGISIEGIGHDSLYKALHHLDAGECRETIIALLEIDRRQEPFDDMLRLERIWMENANGWFGHLRQLLNDVALLEDPPPSYAVLARKSGEATTRLLITELALRGFQIERRSLPDRLDQLTSEFLPELPIDPFDPEGRLLRYIRTDDGYVLYSIGADSDDDGGRPLARDESGWWDPSGDGDLRLDLLFPPDDDTDDAEPKD